MNDRLFPARPILAVSAAVFRDGRALIIRRARAPLLGHFSLPGGGVEVGETLAAALARELLEEVQIEAEIIAFNRHVEAIFREGTRIQSHFVIASFVARWTRGEPRRATKSTPSNGSIPPPPCPRRRRRNWARFSCARRGSKLGTREHARCLIFQVAATSRRRPDRSSRTSRQRGGRGQHRCFDVSRP